MFALDTRILVVDDMMTMRKIVKKILSGAGFTDISEAENGLAGWEKLEAMARGGKPAGLVLCDCNMPKMTGLELLIKVRKSADLKSTRFIMITAESERDQVMVAVEHKVDGYIVKPFDDKMLLEKLAAISSKISKAA